MMDFLYFPDNKLEYIPAVISLLFFMALSFITYRYFKKNSEKEAIKMKAFEEEVMKRIQEEQ